MLKKIIFTFVLFSLINFSYAQYNSADDYFNVCAQNYINANYKTVKTILAEGLEKYPDDARLKGIAEKLKEQEQKQQQQNEEQQNKEDQEKQDQQKDEQEEQQKQAEEKQAQQANPEEDKEKLSKEEAQRILKALSEEQQDKEKKKAPVRGGGRYTEKDW